MLWCTRVWALLILLSPPLWAQPAEHLSGSQQAEIRFLMHRLYILGERSQEPDGSFHATGILGHQSEALSQLEDLWQLKQSSPDQVSTTILRTEARRLYEWQQAQRDSALLFMSQVRDPEFLRSAYRKFALESSNPDQPDFEEIILLIQLEIDRRKFLVEWPFFQTFTPLPALRGSRLRLFLSSLSPEDQNLFSKELIEKLKVDEELSFREFKEIQKILGRDERSQSSNLQAYLNYRCLSIFKDQLPARTQVEWNEHLDRIEAEVQELAKGLKAEGEFRISKKYRELGWLLLEARIELKPQVEFNLEVLNSDLNQNAYQWTLQTYPKDFREQLSSDDANDLSSLFSPENNLRAYFDQIDLLVQERFTKDEAFEFHSCLELVKHKAWTKLPKEKIPSLKFSEALRNLLAARLFPQLSLQSGRALLEQNLLELKESERQNLFRLAFPNVQDLMTFMKWYHTIDAFNEAQVLELHERSLEALMNLHESWVKPVKAEDLEHRILLDGSRVKDLEIARERKKYELFSNPQQGSPLLPNWLEEWWTLQFNPYPEFWAEERQRYSDTWKRREILRSHLSTASALQEKFKLADEGQRAEIVHEIKTLGTKLESQFAHADSPDGGSLMVYTSSFLYGLKPHDGNDILRLAKAAGIGTVFFVVSKFLGGKRVAVFILGDTSLRFITAHYFSDPKEGFNLKKGYSTYLGLWTAQSLSHMGSTLDGAFNSASIDDSLDHFEEFGKISGDILAFSGGAFAAGRILDFKQLTRLRKIEAAQTEIADLQAKISRTQTQIQDLTHKLETCDAQILVLERSKALPEDILAWRLKRTEIAQQIHRLTSGTIARHQGRLRFLASQSLRSLANSIRGLVVFNPFRVKPRGLPRSWKQKWTDFWQRFKYEDSLGVSQYQDKVTSLEKHIHKWSEASIRDLLRQTPISQHMAMSRMLDDLNLYRKKYSQSIAELEPLIRLIERNQEGGVLSAPGAVAEDLSLAFRALNTSAESLISQAQKLLELANKQKDLLILWEAQSQKLSTPTNSGAIQRGLFQIENFKRSFADRVFFWRSKRPEVSAPRPKQDVQRFYAESYLRLQLQIDALMRAEKNLSQAIHQNLLPRSAKLIDLLNEFQSQLKQAGAESARLRPHFMGYFKN